MTNTKKRVGIVLFQLGGPDSLANVEPFLRNLFSDPDIIPLGPLNFIRGPLASYIAKKRCVPVAQRYGMIGRRSPIGILTERQRVRLVEAVRPYIDPVAVTAMRYWSRSPKMPLPPLSVPNVLMNSSSFLSILITPTPPRSAASRNGAASMANRSTRYPNAPSNVSSITRSTFRPSSTISASASARFRMPRGFISSLALTASP